MSGEPDACKGGKPGHKCPKCGTRHQSVRQYVNRNKPIVSPPVDWLPDADDGMPQAPDETKAAGNPVPPSPGSRPVTDRVSPPLTAGHAAPSTGDHGAAFADPMNQPGPRALAYRHENLRQGTTNPLPLVTMTSRAGDNQNGDRDITYWAGRVGLDRLDAAGASGMPGPPGNPASRRMDHIAPIGANNGTHGLADVVSRAAPMAVKAETASDRQRIMRDTMRRLG